MFYKCFMNVLVFMRRLISFIFEVSFLINVDDKCSHELNCLHVLCCIINFFPAYSSCYFFHLSEQVIVTVNHVPQAVQTVTCLVKGDQGYTSGEVPASTNHSAEGFWIITCSALVSPLQLHSPICKYKYM